MRKWIDIITESDGQITVYHGGSGSLTSPLVLPFFTTTHFEMANSYARTKDMANKG